MDRQHVGVDFHRRRSVIVRVSAPVMLVFRDGLGRRWVRWPHGKLTRVAPSVSQLERLGRPGVSCPVGLT